MSKHFKMYVTINNVIGEKRVNLAYPIKNFDSSEEVAVVSMFNDTINYEFTEPHMIDLGLRNKQIMAGTYTRQELVDLVEGEIKLTQLIEVLEYKERIS